MLQGSAFLFPRATRALILWIQQPVNNIDYFDAVVIAGGKSVQREDGFFIVVTDGFQRSHFPGEGFFRGHVRSYLEIAAGILSVRDEINLRIPCFSDIDLAAAAQ